MIIHVNIFYLWTIYNFLLEIDGNWCFHLYKVNKKWFRFGIFRQISNCPQFCSRNVKWKSCVSYMCLFWFSVICIYFYVYYVCHHCHVISGVTQPRNYTLCTISTPSIQQGLVNGDPDVDAIFRMTRKHHNKGMTIFLVFWTFLNAASACNSLHKYTVTSQACSKIYI